MSSVLRRTGPFAHRNARLYVLFTVLYNARAYYPVLAVFFTDLGLTLDRFVFLNLMWALAIFALEVPSGALADTLGRKKLLVFSALLMVVEMAILLLAPKDGGTLLFALCILNRVLSGASEAAASGADEAIAYDALPEEGRESAWDEVLSAAMRWRAAGFLVTMALGGLLYDPAWLAGIGLHIPVELAHRFPLLSCSCRRWPAWRSPCACRRPRTLRAMPRNAVPRPSASPCAPRGRPSPPAASPRSSSADS